MIFKSMNGLPNRRSIRLKQYDYHSKGVYHVTICARHRECLFGRIEDRRMILNAAGKVVEDELLAMPTHFSDIEVESYVVMPNHVHLLLAMCVGADAINGVPTMNYSLGQIIGAFKAGVSRRLGQAVWQSRYYDHIIRNENDLLETMEYIQNNPTAWEKDDYYLPWSP